METALFRVKFRDGSEYRIFCGNKKQKERFFRSTGPLVDVEVSEIINGIHTVKQWEAITEKL